MSAYVYRRVCSLEIHDEGNDLGSQEPVDLVQSQLAAVIEHLRRKKARQGRIEWGKAGKVALMWDAQDSMVGRCSAAANNA